MDLIYQFSKDNLDIIFFIYGFPFIIIGIAIFAQLREGSGFRLADILWLLALFGITHGINEFLDMWAIIKGRHPILDLIRWFILIISYFFLFEFGRQCFRLVKPESPLYQKKIARFLVWWIPPVICFFILISGFMSSDLWTTGSIWTRYLLCLPGGFLIGHGFYLYYKVKEEIFEQINVRRYFLLGGISFLSYGILGGLVVPKGNFFPASVLNTELFLSTVKIPVQVFRAICAVTAAWAVSGMLKIFNFEMRGRLQESQRMLESQLAENIRLTKNLSSLYDISKDILTEFNTKTLLRKISDDACKLIGCQYSAIGILNDEGGYEYFVSSGIKQQAVEDITKKYGLPIRKGLLGYPLKIGKPLRVDDISKHPSFQGLPAGLPEMKTFMGVPITLHNKIVGGLYFAEKLNGEKFTEGDEHLAISFGAVVSLAINNLLMLKEIENLASFPRESIYPIMECDMDCNITYLNPAARRLLNELNIKGFEILPPTIHELTKGLKSSDKKLLYHEVKYSGRVFGEHLHLVRDKRAVRIYIYDITEQKLTEDKIEQRYLTQEVINNLLRILLKDMPLNQLLQSGIDTILSIPFLPLLPKGGIFLIQDESDILELVINRNLPAPLQRMCRRIPFGKCACGKAASTGKIQFAKQLDNHNDDQCAMITPYGHYNIPILSKGRTLGVIVLYLKEEHKQEKGEIEFLQAIADILAGAIERKSAEMMLKESYRQLRDLTNHLQSIREEERARIAREIHDELGQLMTALKIDLIWLRNRLQKDEGRLLDKIKSMLDVIEMGSKAIQRISSELRPRILDDLGLPAAIEWQAKEFQEKAGIKCEVNIISEDIAVDKELATSVFRIFQEAITNVVRHADATQVWVNLKVDSLGLELAVTDNGKGITKEQISDPLSFGLISMRERILPWDGKVEIIGIKNEGTTIKVNIPIKK